MSATFVYLVQAGDDGLIKIGTTGRPAARLRALAAMSPIPLRMLRLRAGVPTEERDLHARFAHLRVNGEWFRPEADLLAFAIERDDDDIEPAGSGMVGPKGGPQPGSGRPKRAEPEGPGDAMSNHTIAVLDSEWRDITTAALADGERPGGWMRDLAVGVARGTVRIVRAG